MKTAGLGGWMVWNVDLDEFSGGTLCPSMHDVAYPLLTALNDALTSTHSPPTTSSTVPQSVFAPRLLRVIITRIYELPWIKGCCHTTVAACVATFSYLLTFQSTAGRT